MWYFLSHKSRILGSKCQQNVRNVGNLRYQNRVDTRAYKHIQWRIQGVGRGITGVTSHPLKRLKKYIVYYPNPNRSIYPLEKGLSLLKAISTYHTTLLSNPFVHFVQTSSKHLGKAIDFGPIPWRTFVLCTDLLCNNCPIL